MFDSNFSSYTMSVLVINGISLSLHKISNSDKYLSYSPCGILDNFGMQLGEYGQMEFKSLHM